MCVSLSICNILLSFQETLLYLRQFKKLKSLNLAGNELCATPHYEQLVVAHLPSLRYLDWRRILDELVSSGRFLI